MVRMDVGDGSRADAINPIKGAVSCRPSCSSGPALLYIVRFVRLALTTLRKGHTVRFWFGIIVSGLWVVGGPVGRAAKARMHGVSHDTTARP